MYLALILAYLLGSIPFGLLLAKAMGAGDIRKIGSGNIGATNALRTGNKKLGALTLLGDMLKGTAAVTITYLLAPEFAPLAGIIAVLGHVFPVWLRFKGGKGVATALGAMLGLAPLVFLLCIITWLGMFKWKRISSLAALTAFALAPLYAYFGSDMQTALAILLMSIIIFATHRSNIERLMRGEEAGFKK
jgi:acyl phosphate:glycerol-3-phosphate acyltransferase